MMIMAPHERFSFKNIGALSQKAAALGADIPLSEDISPLLNPVRIGGLTAPNAMAVLPMEGCDSNPDGSPSELVVRRYTRLYGGGAGLIWWEACAVTEDGKANDLQMRLTQENAGAFAGLIKNAQEEAARRNGADHKPLQILQLTHSGRYARPYGHQMCPILPQHDPYLDKRVHVDPDAPLVSDAYLDDLVADYARSAALACQIGFDGVDIKACHRYLVNELFACRSREGKYGGSLENRTRLLFDIIKAVRREVKQGFIIASRFNVYDAHPYPYGFGVDARDAGKMDFTEPALLTRRLVAAGADLLSASAGNPYYIYPQVSRPFDHPGTDMSLPDEHPLESVARLLSVTRRTQAEAGSIPVLGYGCSWLRQFWPNAAAAAIKRGDCALAGLGRMAFAYPDAPRDIKKHGALDPLACCMTCSRCTQIMRDHGRTGCVLRDAEVYAPLYARYRQEAQMRENANKGGE